MRENDKNTAIYVAYEEAVPFDPAAPEKNLLRAVLLSAMLDLKKPGDAGRRAVEYFLSPDEDYIFSFASICQFLNVDTDKILAVTGLKGKPLTAPCPSSEAPHLDELEVQGEVESPHRSDLS